MDLPHTVMRRAVADDAPHLERLYRQLVDNPDICVLPGRIEALADDPATALFVCDVDGQVRGTVLVSLCRDVMFRHQPFAVVENLVLDESVRGQGIGALLLRHVEQFCAAHDCSKMMLLSSVTRVEAHRFFAGMGFRGDNKRGFVKYRRDFSPDI